MYYQTYRQTITGVNFKINDSGYKLQHIRDFCIWFEEYYMQGIIFSRTLHLYL